MNVQQVPLEWVNRTWPVVQGFIADALARSDGDFTVDHAASYVSTGQWILLVAVDDQNQVQGAATVELFNRPNDRVAFITATGGRLGDTRDTVEQAKALVAALGATTMECAAYGSAARLWRMHGFREKHQVFGVKL
jgi:hypothetical protein